MATYCNLLFVISNCQVYFKKILFIDVIEHFDDFYHTVGYEIEDLSTPYTKYIEENLKNDDVDKYIKNIIENKNIKGLIICDGELTTNLYIHLRFCFKFLNHFWLWFSKKFRYRLEKWKKEISEMNTMSYTKFYFFKLKCSANLLLWNNI